MSKRVSFRTGDQALVREINLSLIMNRLHSHAPISRAALAEMTGLNKSTVSSLVNELIERRFVYEVGALSSGVGRPSVQLRLNPQAGYIVSAEIGVGFIAVLATNFTAEILWLCRENTAPQMDHQHVLDQVVALIREAIRLGSEAVHGQKLLGIAVGIPGLVNQENGELLFAPNLFWQNVPIRSKIQTAFPGVLCYVDNEANMAALGEYFFGAAQNYDEIMYLSAGVGLGGAMVRDGQVIRGASGLAGEFGHMLMYPDGELCHCGNRGCWETEVSQAGIFRTIRKAVQSGQTSVLVPDRMTVQDVIAAARAGDAVTRSALERLGRELGMGIASLVNVLNPNLVLFGGLISLAGDILLPIIQETLSRHALKWNAEAVTIAPARHTFNACVMGGVAVVYQTILSQSGIAA